MRDSPNPLSRIATTVIVAFCLTGLVFWLLPKSLKSLGTFILTLLAAIACCCWIDANSRPRRKGQAIDTYMGDGYLDSGSLDGVAVTEGGDTTQQFLLLEAKSVDRMPAKQARFLAYLPQWWELFSLILPLKVRREAFDPAFNDLKEKYLLAGKYRGKGARCWIAVAFTVLSLLMLLDCFRVLLQSGAGKILLNFLPDAWRNFWRRQ